VQQAVISLGTSGSGLTINNLEPTNEDEEFTNQILANIQYIPVESLIFFIKFLLFVVKPHKSNILLVKSLIFHA